MNNEHESSEQDYFGFYENLSDREKSLGKLDKPLKFVEEVVEMKEKLASLGFVRCEGGPVLMGQDKGLLCSIEGRRSNETPSREIVIPPFYISKFDVSNVEFEKFDLRHTRTNTSSRDKSPVTCLTYGRVISYVIWLNQQTNMAFSIPTEPQWVAAVAPYGWQYSEKPDGRPERSSQNVYKSFVDKYPQGELGATLDVDDARVPPNYLGLYHATGNVSVYTLGHYSTTGHWGSASDGSYSVVVGGNFRLCPLGTRVVTRGILDVTAIVDTAGIRLVHPEPESLLKVGE